MSRLWVTAPFFVGLLVTWLLSHGSPRSEGIRLSLGSLDFQLGPAVPGERIPFEVRLVNDTGQGIALGEPVASCTCFGLTLDRTEVPPGVAVRVRGIASVELLGIRRETVRLTWGNGRRESFDLNLQVAGIPGPSLHTSTIPLGTREKESAEFEVLLPVALDACPSFAGELPPLDVQGDLAGTLVEERTEEGWAYGGSVIPATELMGALEGRAELFVDGCSTEPRTIRLLAEVTPEGVDPLHWPSLRVVCDVEEDGSASVDLPRTRVTEARIQSPVEPRAEVSVESTPTGTRVTLSCVGLRTLPDDEWPARITVRVASSRGPLQAVFLPVRPSFLEAHGTR